MFVSAALAKRLGVGVPPKEPSHGRRKSVATTRIAASVAERPLLPSIGGPVRLVIQGKAIPKERPRVVKGGTQTYTPARTKAFAAKVKAAGTAAVGRCAPWSGPVEGVVTFELAPPKSWHPVERQMALAGQIIPTARPDFDNTLKNVLDSLNGILWVDDSQVARCLIERRYADEDRVVVEFRPMAGIGSSQAADRKAGRRAAKSGGGDE